MQWQDWVLSTGTIIAISSLVPTIRGKHKPALSTSVVTTLVLVVFAFTYMSLSLWFSAISVTLGAIAWLILALQKYRQLKK